MTGIRKYPKLLSTMIGGAGRTRTGESRSVGAATLAEPRTPRRGAAEGRECGCPPWVLCCANWDGQILVLVDEDAAAPHCGIDGVLAPYCVAVIPGYGPCSGGCGNIIVIGHDGRYSDTTNLPAAEAEFRAREAALLGRAE